MSEAKKLTCISIGPFGKNEDERRARVDLEQVIKLALPEFEYTPFPDVPNIVMGDDLFSRIIDADLVIVDLRNLNPNVMYELGLRHAFNKPVLHLKDPQTELSWDIDKNFTITYPQHITVSLVDKLKSEIQARVKKIFSLKSDNNPSFNTFISHYKSGASIDHLVGVDTDIRNVLNEMNSNFNEFSSRMNRIERNQRISNSLLPSSSTGLSGILGHSIPKDSGEVGVLGDLTGYHSAKSLAGRIVNDE